MKTQKGSKVKVHYVGTLNDGSEFDNSYKRGATLDFEVGGGQMIKGFDDAVLEMEVGQKKTVTIPPAEAYGEYSDEANIMVPKTNFPENFEFIQGGLVEGSTEAGQPVAALILEIHENEVLMDFNHPLAGESLNFEIELIEIGE
jgi:FKBP-type peptidyl-prolyl cis-trans isomerase 2